MSILAVDGTGEARVAALLHEAAAWRLLGLLLERPHDEWWQGVKTLSRACADPEIVGAAEAAVAAGDEGHYLAIVGPGGPVSLRAVTYRGMEDPGRIIADLRSFYEAFAFHPATEEAPDHLAVEAGFLGYLYLKEAYARARGSEDEADVAAQAAACFREEHLSGLAWPVADRLQSAGVRYLAVAATALARRAGSRRRAEAKLSSPAPICNPCPLECGDV